MKKTTDNLKRGDYIKINSAVIVKVHSVSMPLSDSFMLVHCEGLFHPLAADTYYMHDVMTEDELPKPRRKRNAQK